jgi:uncharacterized membrane protein YfcA
MALAAGRVAQGMDGIAPGDLVLFSVATFAASLIAGLAGFAFGLVAAAIWLHVLTPLQTTTLIVAFGLVVQGLAVWRLRRTLRFDRLWPFLAGGAMGVPIGAELLRWANPQHIRVGVGALLILFSLYSLVRPKLAVPTAGGRAADGSVGFLGGVLGGTTGLGGILPTVWCNLRNWPKDEQRAVFQTVAVAIFAVTILWLGGTGSVSVVTVRLFLIGLPWVLVGTWLGLRFYGRLDDASFRQTVLVLLLVSGAVLLV